MIEFGVEFDDFDLAYLQYGMGQKSEVIKLEQEV
jgi:hypothetical protein